MSLIKEEIIVFVKPFYKINIYPRNNFVNKTNDEFFEDKTL
jgi:hypothetical protein